MLRRVNAGAEKYRLGDAVLLHGAALAEAARFPGSVAEQYAALCAQSGLCLHYEWVRHLALQRAEYGGWQGPGQDEVVVHLRTGDRPLNATRMLGVIANARRAGRCAKVTLVSAMHFHAEPEPARVRLCRDMVELSALALSKALGVGVGVRSSEDPDEDFAYLLRARRLVCTTGWFSLLAALCTTGAVHAPARFMELARTYSAAGPLRMDGGFGERLAALRAEHGFGGGA